MRSAVLLAGGLLAGCGLPSVDEQRLELRVSTLAAPPDLQIVAEATWLGEELATPLLDDGVPPDERAQDGVFSATWQGAPVRMLPLRLLVSRGAAAPVEAYAGVEVLTLDSDSLAWSLELDDPAHARRVPVPVSSRQASFLELLKVAGSLLWALGVMVFVTWLVRRAEARP